MRLRDRHAITKPEIMIIPMIDIMFFLLVFFMMSTLFLEDKPIEETALIEQAAAEAAQNSRFSVVVRADQGLDYGMVIALLDRFKSRGILHIGLAAQGK